MSHAGTAALSSGPNGLLTVLCKEWLVQRRQMRVWWRLLLNLGLVLACFGWLYFVLLDARLEPSDIFRVLQRAYSTPYLFLLALAILQVLPPAAGAIAREHEQGTLEMLLQTRLRPWEIVAGKALAACLPTLAVLSATFVASLALTAFLGVWMRFAMLAQVSLLVMVLSTCAFGIYGSTLFRSTARAIGATAAVLGFTYALPYLFGFAFRFFQDVRAVSAGMQVVAGLLPVAIFGLGCLEVGRPLLRARLPAALRRSVTVLLLLLGAAGYFGVLLLLNRLWRYDDIEQSIIRGYHVSYFISLLTSLILFFLAARQVDRLRVAR